MRPHGNERILKTLFLLEPAKQNKLSESPDGPSSPPPVELPQGASIDQALEYCISHAEREGIPLEEALARLGPASFCFVCLLLAIPFIQPLPLGPYTMASGITFIAAGWQMSRGHAAPRLPEKMRGVRIHGKAWLAVLRVCQKLLTVCRKFTRPRQQTWVIGEAGTRFVGRLVFIGGALLAIPVANLPFNNTLPALMILFAVIAWLEKDGWMIFISLFFGLLTLLYFIAVVIALIFFGDKVLGWMKSLWPTLQFIQQTTLWY